MNPAR